MNASQFEWFEGVITLWDLDVLDEQFPAQEQLSELKEDLAQIAFSNGNLVDIGWYPEFDREGAFSVTVIQNSNWDQLLYQKSTSDLREVAAAIRQAVHIAKQ